MLMGKRITATLIHKRRPNKKGVKKKKLFWENLVKSGGFFWTEKLLTVFDVRIYNLSIIYNLSSNFAHFFNGKDFSYAHIFGIYVKV